MPYKKQKAISSNKKYNKYGLMTDLGLRQSVINRNAPYDKVIGGFT